MNINLLSISNNKKTSHICVTYGSEDVYTAGKSANCDLIPNWAQFISVAGQRLYTIQRHRPISANTIEECGTEQKALFHVINSLQNKRKEMALPSWHYHIFSTQKYLKSDKNLIMIAAWI